MSDVPSPLLAQALVFAERVRTEVGAAFIGSHDTINMLLAALAARGHVLIEGNPGIAKTTLAKAFAAALGCTFRRVQFTPDLLPADITGSSILDMRSQQFELRQGPIFTHVLLGDEINRAPAKTQSALLEAMAERHVTIDGITHELTAPFFVIATQNPLEQAGTYALPEAQLDRFLIKLPLSYPDAATEKRMLQTYDKPPPQVRAVLTVADVLTLQAAADTVYVADELLEYIVGLAHYTRQHPAIAVGASPRAALALLHIAKANAALAGRAFVLPDDIKQLAVPVLAHRMVAANDADADHAPIVVREALGKVPYRPRGA